MEMSLREMRVDIICKKLAKIERERNEKTITRLAKEWRMDRNEVRSSFRFNKYKLFSYTVVLNSMSQGKSFDEIFITFEEEVFCKDKSLLSFSFHVFNDNIELIPNFDDSFSDQIYDDAMNILRLFITKEMEIPL